MKNDKKKTLVLAGLGTALVAVGAFQFLPKGGGSAQPVPPANKASNSASKANQGSSASSSEAAGSAAKLAIESNPSGPNAAQNVDPQQGMLAELGKGSLAKRDPFAPQGVLNEAPIAPATAVTKPQTTQSNSGRDYKPEEMVGRIPPINPYETGPGTGLPNGPISLNGAHPLRQEGEFAYTMKGVIVGNKPMAVFEDDNGNQRLVPLGGSIDRDTKVVGIEKGKVRIRHRGKDKTLNLPEGP